MDRELLYRFFEGTSSEEEMREIKTWMESSGENERLFLKERKLYDAILLSGDKSDLTKKKRSIGNKLLLNFSKIAAVAILTLVLNYAWQHYGAPEEEVAMQSISVPPGQRVNLTLSDGTNVWLNARTTISYPVNFNKKERLLALDGEAYFEVAPDTRRPFIVETKTGKVEALGTHFNVESYSFQEKFEATLMEGKVKVSLLDDEMTNVILSPHNKAYLKDGSLQVEYVSDYTTYRWREGLICFKEASFVSIMNEFEKYYGVKVHIENQKVLQYYYTGKFRHTDGVDYALRVLQKDIFFTYQKDDERQVIYIR
ncbi:FecR domain-containing protein [Parabacteroides sp. OttesenSCG-928-O15]|nr:FecR domain-containing protein [Parabacteroides sp. OttesenSCG-928-O15]